MKAKKPSAPQSIRHQTPKATSSAPSATSSKVQLPFQEFQKLAGTLSEIVGPCDLDTLNSALHYLFIFLREASRQFYEEADEGRPHD
jgi:hypothetical protein